jgi:ribosomal protein S18 acetylase RimI-like enzyme
MVELTPMTQAEFELFLEHEIRQYADEQALAGYVSEAGAISKSRNDHRALLPKGLQTRGHYFYTVRESAQGADVGVIWLGTSLDSSRPTGSIFALEIHEPFRRQGYARQAMDQLEEIAQGMGLKQLGLHLFVRNEAGRALCDSLGYTVSGVNMGKEL